MCCLWMFETNKMYFFELNKEIPYFSEEGI